MKKTKRVMILPIIVHFMLLFMSGAVASVKRAKTEGLRSNKKNILDKETYNKKLAIRKWFEVSENHEGLLNIEDYKNSKDKDTIYIIDRIQKTSTLTLTLNVSSIYKKKDFANSNKDKVINKNGKREIEKEETEKEETEKEETEKKASDLDELYAFVLDNKVQIININKVENLNIYGISSIDENLLQLLYKLCSTIYYYHLHFIECNLDNNQLKNIYNIDIQNKEKTVESKRVINSNIEVCNSTFISYISMYLLKRLEITINLINIFSCTIENMYFFEDIPVEQNYMIGLGKNTFNIKIESLYLDQIKKDLSIANLGEEDMEAIFLWSLTKYNEYYKTIILYPNFEIYNRFVFDALQLNIKNSNAIIIIYFDCLKRYTSLLLQKKKQENNALLERKIEISSLFIHLLDICPETINYGDIPWLKCNHIFLYIILPNFNTMEKAIINYIKKNKFEQLGISYENFDFAYHSSDLNISMRKTLLFFCEFFDSETKETVKNNIDYLPVMFNYMEIYNFYYEKIRNITLYIDQEIANNFREYLYQKANRNDFLCQRINYKTIKIYGSKSRETYIDEWANLIDILHLMGDIRAENLVLSNIIIAGKLPELSNRKINERIRLLGKLKLNISETLVFEDVSICVLLHIMNTFNIVNSTLVIFNFSNRYPIDLSMFIALADYKNNPNINNVPLRLYFENTHYLIPIIKNKSKRQELREILNRITSYSFSTFNFHMNQPIFEEKEELYFLIENTNQRLIFTIIDWRFLVWYIQKKKKSILKFPSSRMLTIQEVDLINNGLNELLDNLDSKYIYEDIYCLNCILKIENKPNFINIKYLFKIISCFCKIFPNISILDIYNADINTFNHNEITLKEMEKEVFDYIFEHNLNLTNISIEGYKFCSSNPTSNDRKDMMKIELNLSVDSNSNPSTSTNL